MRLLKYITEKRNVQKLYFAHARALYDSNTEGKALKLIQEKFPDHIIINPNVDWIQGKCDDMGFDIFFKVISTASKIVFMPFKDNKVGNGTWRECQYGHKEGIPLFEVNPYRGTIKEFEFNKIKYLSPEETFSRINKKCQANYKVYEDGEI